MTTGRPRGPRRGSAAATSPTALRAAAPALLDSATMRQLERLSLAFLDAIVTGVSGQRSGPAAAVGSEFADYRHYAAGDDLRRIDWHVYGRLRELMIKVAPEEGHVDLAILLDHSRSMDSGRPTKRWHAQRLAAVLGAVALLRADAVRVHALSDGGVASTDRLDAPRLLVQLTREIERLPAGRATDLPSSLRAYRRRGEPADLAVLITDALTPAEQLGDALAELAAGARSASVLHVTDPREATLRLRGAVRLRDRETGQVVEADVSTQLAAAYAERFRRFCLTVAEGCQTAGVRYLRASTDVEPLDLLAGGLAHGSGAVRLVRG
ncbi:MAG TPA: DUF58 domain-containing protein [Candidatus Micrarchaeia archaeon]|nr:DUF58 domain-containing protein [Candidatus Micrarchaeia archaeon]